MYVICLGWRGFKFYDSQNFSFIWLETLNNVYIDLNLIDKI